MLRGLFKGEQSKDFVKLACVTGILPIKKYSSESALNNFDEFTMASPKQLAEFVGFTRQEVAGLCEKYQMDFSEAARWYDGYSFPRMKHLYSPNSVVKAMLSGEFDNYWTKTVAYESLIREFPSGKGCADIVFLPGSHSDKPAMIVELKAGSSAWDAISQIRERQYPESLKHYHRNLLLVGISYDPKSKEHSCVIEEWELPKAPSFTP